MEKRIQILVGFSARRNIGDFCHPRASVGFQLAIRLLSLRTEPLRDATGLPERSKD